MFCQYTIYFQVCEMRRGTRTKKSRRDSCGHRRGALGAGVADALGVQRIARLGHSPELDASGVVGRSGLDDLHAADDVAVLAFHVPAHRHEGVADQNLEPFGNGVEGEHDLVAFVVVPVWGGADRHGDWCRWRERVCGFLFHANSHGWSQASLARR